MNSFGVGPREKIHTVNKENQANSLAYWLINTEFCKYHVYPVNDQALVLQQT